MTPLELNANRNFLLGHPSSALTIHPPTKRTNFYWHSIIRNQLLFVQAMNGFISILLVLFLTLLDTTILITGFQAVVAPPTVKSTTLLFRTTTLESAPPAATEEKLTKEAQELLDTIAARKNGDENAPELIIAQVAPSVRVAISEEFGNPAGSYTPGQLVAGLKALGFDLVFDTNLAADITIIEEGTELLHRLKAKHAAATSADKVPFGEDKTTPEPMPMFTSCCPGWMAFIEKSEPELAKYISTCKSPHMMYGSLVKTYAEELLGVAPNKICFTSVMPCVRKRGESDHECFTMPDGTRHVDNVITTKDTGVLMRMKGIDPGNYESLPFDSPFQLDGEGSGAGQLFGATGGVMEAAVRSVYELVTGEKLPKLELDEIRGLDGVKSCELSLGPKAAEHGLPDKIRVAVCNGLGNAKSMIKKLRSGEAEFDFIEVMACPGGCIAGGGMPKGDVQKRLESIYQLDATRKIRRSHENPVAKKFYEDKLLGAYGSERAHELLHVQPVYGGIQNKEESKDK